MSNVAPHDALRHARERASLDAKDIASKLGMTFNEYIDLERHPDEASTNSPFSVVRRLASLLQIDLSDLLGESDDSDVAVSIGDVPEDQELHLQLKSFREIRGLSIEQVADAIGFEVEAVRRAETLKGSAGELPYRVLMEWAAAIEMPASRLISCTL